MAKPELEFHLPDAEWVAAIENVPGTWARMLAADPQSSDYTRLLRFDAEVDTSAAGVRIHDYWEEVFILDGDLTDISLNKTFTSGMYACRPPGMPHGPWRTVNGVLMLEIRYGGS